MGTTLADVLSLDQEDGRTFRGHSPVPSPPRVFGGQLVAQALAAAGRTVPAGRRPHSLHAHFLRPGDTALPLTYEVDDVHDGGALTLRHVVAVQGDRSLFRLMASFGEPRPGPAHELPSPVPRAFEAVPAAEAGLAGAEPSTRRWAAGLRAVIPLDLRFPALPPRNAVVRGERPAPRQRILVRAADPLPDDPLLHACAIAYASDLLLLSTAMLPHGLVMGDPGVHAVSLGHSVWFHAAARADDWLDDEMESEWAGDGRALCHGRLRDAQGRLVATVAQEGSLRTARA